MIELSKPQEEEEGQDDADQQDWVHERNQLFADEFNVPYIKNVAKAIAEYDLDYPI